MEIYLHTAGRTDAETISIDEHALVGVLVEGHDGEHVWTEDVEVMVDVNVTLEVAGIRNGHHVHRGPCHKVAVNVQIDGSRVDETFEVGPSTTVGTILGRAAASCGLGGETLEATDRATGQRVGHAVHVGSLTRGGECRVALQATPAKVKIIVNARPREVPPGEISFDAVVALAFETPPPGNDLEFTVTYRHGEPANPKGSLLQGKSVRVREGMVFVVTATDKS